MKLLLSVFPVFVHLEIKKIFESEVAYSREICLFINRFSGHEHHQAKLIISNALY